MKKVFCRSCSKEIEVVETLFNSHLDKDGKFHPKRDCDVIDEKGK